MNLRQIFQSASQNLKAGEKHFNEVNIHVLSHDGEITIEDDTFSNITFDKFTGFGINKIGTNAFKETFNKIKSFACQNCLIENEPPKYDIQKILTQMNQLSFITIGLDVNQIPSDFIGSKPSLTSLTLFNRKQNLTIKSGAFNRLNRLSGIEIWDSKIKLIEKGAFKSNSNIDLYKIQFVGCHLTGSSFEMGSFDGFKSPFSIVFMKSNINYLDELVFKPILDQNQWTTIDFFSSEKYNSKIDCDDCKNYWLIKEKRDQRKYQIKYSSCINDDKLSLFSQEIVAKLSQKCK